jgi:hypothetical protein
VQCQPITISVQTFHLSTRKICSDNRDRLLIFGAKILVPFILAVLLLNLSWSRT